MWGIEYSSDNANKLLCRFSGLSTFADVAVWDKVAHAEIQKITETITVIDEALTKSAQRIAAAETEHQKKPFLKRILGGNKEKSKILKELADADRIKSLLDTLGQQLQEKIDITPNNKEEQKALLKELRLKKKELQLEKKEINARMKDIRTTARQKYAKAPYTFTGMLGQTAAQRRALRYDKEAALAPHESAKDGIDRQISLVEREILWAERFE